MLSPEEINTYGFPYVHGIPESIYRNLKMPETLSECNQMIRELKATKKAITGSTIRMFWATSCLRNRRSSYLERPAEVLSISVRR